MGMSKFLDVALECAREAGELAMAYYSQGVGHSLKSDGSPVTQADVSVQRLIINKVHKEFPSHGFVGEENDISDSGMRYVWIIDPIDCTKHFMRGIPLFGILVGLMDKGKMVLGVSHAPALGELAYAEKGSGTFLNGSKISVSAKGSVAESYVSFGSLRSFGAAGKLDQLVQLSQDAFGCRGIGDFWSYHLLAQGKIDVVIEAKTKIWDIAALSVIVEEAGGRMTDMYGKNLTLESTSALATNGKLHAEIVKRFS
jgi:histidinol-phosphatase